MLVRGEARGQKTARQSHCQLPPHVDGSKRTNTMRKITAIAVALGFLTSVSLPAFATPAVNGIVKSDELSAKKKKSSTKKSALSTDLSAAKKKKKKSSSSMEKKSSLTTDLSAAKKKKKKSSSTDKKSSLATDLSAKKKKKSSPDKKSEILYRIAA